MAVALQDLERLQRAPVRPAAQDAQERIAYLESIVAARDKELAYIKALAASTKFDGNTKWFILAQRDYERTEMPNEDGQWRIDMEERGRDIGTSPSTPSRKTELLIENDLLESDGPVPYPKKNGDEVPLVFGRLDPRLKTLEGIQSLDDSKLRPWGGDRYDGTCHCGGRLKISVRYTAKQEIRTCDTCHEITVGKVGEHLPPIEPGVYDEHFKRKAQNQLDSTASARSDEKSAPIVAEEHVEACRNLQHPGTNNTPPLQVAQEDSPSLDPHVANILFPWLGKRRGDDRIIYATGDVDDTNNKYKYKPEGYTPDLAAYLAGDIGHIYGSRPGRADGTTWLLGYDFDDKQPEHARNHVEYMTRLAAAGIASFYFLRRSDRGHLEIHFTRLVDALAAHRWITSIVPELASVECFPIKGRDALSWPLYQRIYSEVQECAVEAMRTDKVGMIGRCKGVRSQPKLLAWMVEHCVTDASLVPAREETRPYAGGGYWKNRCPGRHGKMIWLRPSTARTPGAKLQICAVASHARDTSRLCGAANGRRA